MNRLGKAVAITCAMMFGLLLLAGAGPCAARAEEGPALICEAGSGAAEEAGSGAAEEAGSGAAEEAVAPKIEVVEDAGNLEAQASEVYSVSFNTDIYYDEAYEVLDLTNAARAAKGLPAVQWNTALERCALQRARETAIYFTTLSPDGTTFDESTVFQNDKKIDAYYGNSSYSIGVSASNPVASIWEQKESLTTWAQTSNVTRIGAACVKFGSKYFLNVMYGSGTGTSSSRVGSGVSYAQGATVGSTRAHIGARLSPSSMTLLEGNSGSFTLMGSTAGYAPINVLGTSWSSSKSSVATVSNSGTVSARSFGATSVSCNLDGSVLCSAQVTVTQAQGSKFDLARLSLEFSESDLVYLYTGAAIRPFALWTGGNGGPRVYANDYPQRIEHGAVEANATRLTEGVDYTASYANNVQDGTATATFTGIGNVYTGAKTVTFQIKKSPFADVSPATPHANDVIWLEAQKVSEGWDMGTYREFRPYASVARADMAAFLFRVAQRWGLVSASWKPAGSVAFSDVNSRTSHYREIMWLAEKGISKGWTVKGDKKEFRPYANVARADMAAFLAGMYRLLERSTTYDSEYGQDVFWDFADVSDSTAHATDIYWLGYEGVSRGYADGTFRPYANVARCDMAAFLRRIDALRG